MEKILESLRLQLREHMRTKTIRDQLAYLTKQESLVSPEALAFSRFVDAVDVHLGILQQLNNSEVQTVAEEYLKWTVNKLTILNNAAKAKKED